MEQQSCLFCNRTTLVLPGFNFRPTDQELISHYLSPYAALGRILCWNDVHFELVYGKNPGELLRNDDVRYFLTIRTKSGSGRINRSFNCVDGTWTVKEGKRKILSPNGIGYKTMLTYCVNGKSEGYTMYEYELPQYNYQQMEPVLCCVKKSQQRLRSQQRQQAEEAAAAAVGFASTNRNNMLSHNEVIDLADALETMWPSADNQREYNIGGIEEIFSSHFINSGN